MNNEEEIKKKKRKSNNVNFNVYIHKLIKSKKDTLEITKESILMLNYLILHIGTTIVNTVSLVKKHSKNKTISVNYFYHAMGLILGLEKSHDLNIICEENSTLFKNFNIQKEELKEIAEEKGEKTSYKPMQLNVKAGLIMSVSRVERVFMGDHKRISTLSMIYFTALIENIMNDIIDQIVIIMEKLDKQRIKPKHIKNAVYSLKEYKPLTGKVCFSL